MSDRQTSKEANEETRREQEQENEPRSSSGTSGRTTRRVGGPDLGLDEIESPSLHRRKEREQKEKEKTLQLASRGSPPPPPSSSSFVQDDSHQRHQKTSKTPLASASSRTPDVGLERKQSPSLARKDVKDLQLASRGSPPPRTTSVDTTTIRSSIPPPNPKQQSKTLALASRGSPPSSSAREEEEGEFENEIVSSSSLNPKQSKTLALAPRESPPPSPPQQDFGGADRAIPGRKQTKTLALAPRAAPPPSGRIPHSDSRAEPLDDWTPAPPTTTTASMGFRLAPPPTTSTPSPGAFRVRGRRYRGDVEDDEEDTDFTVAATENDNDQAQTNEPVPGAAPRQTTLAVAHPVEPPPAVLIEAEPELAPKWTRRRICYVATALLAVIGIVIGVVAAMVSGGGSSNNLSSNDAPTPAPTAPLPVRWFQVGQDLDGEALGDQAGFLESVSLSKDGTVLAVGASLNDGRNGANLDAGHVRVYQYADDTNWTQLGQDIDGEAPGDKSGSSVSLSKDGSTVAVGARGNGGNGINAGHVRVYRLDQESWTQIGEDIDGTAQGDQFGISVSLSLDGTSLIAGAIHNTGDKPGYAKFFRFDGESWNQTGQVALESNGDTPGFVVSPVSLSADGLTAAIGAPQSSDVAQFAGSACIYRLEEQGWNLAGECIRGNETLGRFGSAVSLSEDATTVAIGAPTSFDRAGFAQVFRFDGEQWTQVGQTLTGRGIRDLFGRSVSLSADGAIVAIGADETDDPGNDANGYVEIYRLDGDTWNPIGREISGEDDNDGFGASISLSGNGAIIAVGAHLNDDNGESAGHARVFAELENP